MGNRSSTLRRLASYGFLTAIFLILFVSVQIGVARAGTQSPEQQRCVLAAEKQGTKVASSQSKEARMCFHKAASGTLAALGVSAQQCVVGDLRGKVAKGRERAAAALARKCSALPDFGLSAPSVVGDAGSTEALAFIAMLFGADVDAIVNDSMSRDDLRCISAMLKSTEKLMAAQRKEFARCVKSTLSAGAESAAALEPCLEAMQTDTNPKLIKARIKLEQQFSKKCNEADLGRLFPGSCPMDDTSTFLACIEEQSLCASCRTQVAIHESAGDCDQVDNSFSDLSCPPSPTRPRGISAGVVLDIEAARDRFDEDHTKERHNINWQAYDSHAERAAQVLDVLKGDDIPSPSVRIVTTSDRVPWSSFLGRLESASFFATELDPGISNWPMPDRARCIEPVERIDCCSYVLTEGVQSSGNTTDYFSTMDLYSSESSAINALGQIYATRAFVLPFADGEVNLAQGWLYNNGDPHASVDYLKPSVASKDSAFEVKAVAGGTVVSKYWDPWHGNVVIIEHSGQDGFSYRSHYFHLRDGKAHDLNEARTQTVVMNNGTAADGARMRYLAFANLADPDDLHWGTEAKAIKVDVGDVVSSHEQIGWSGNTGPGGAAAGLDSAGAPNDPIGANNHLHFMLAVKHAAWTADEWLFVDPYGVYEEAESGCYDLLDNTEYDRLFAPFYPYFHGVDLAVFNSYLYYYGQMGRSPATLSVQKTPSGVQVAGAFKVGLGVPWYVYNYMTPAGFQLKFNEMVADPPNLRIVDQSVTLDAGGIPRHNGVFRPDAVGDWWSFGNENLPAYQSTFDDLFAQGYDLIDFFAYRDGSVDRAASIYEKLAGGFIHERGMDSQTFKTTADAHASNGWLPVDMNVQELSNGTSYSALYRQTGDSRMMHWGMTAAEYQQWTNYYLSNGWDLVVVQNYANGGRYAAIWRL